jgi:hypothetical protein
MGLDMYLSYDGVEVGYWRKHPNLHGFIVNTFADGMDECQEIVLNLEAVDTILNAIIKDDLPTTTGFFFGTSHPEDKQPSINIFLEAKRLLKIDASKELIYQASW